MARHLAAGLPGRQAQVLMGAFGLTAVEIPSGHLATVSHPTEVTQLIETAAEAVTAS